MFCCGILTILISAGLFFSLFCFLFLTDSHMILKLQRTLRLGTGNRKSLLLNCGSHLGLMISNHDLLRKHLHHILETKTHSCANGSGLEPSRQHHSSLQLCEQFQNFQCSQQGPLNHSAVKFKFFL